MALYEKTTPAAQSGGSTIPPGTMVRTEPLLLTDANISAILDYLNTQYGAGTGKNALTVGFDSTTNQFFFTIAVPV